MSKSTTATDAFNEILQKVDETLIQAEVHLRGLRNNSDSSDSIRSSPELTVVPSPNATNSERSCSPDSIPRKTASKSSCHKTSPLSSISSSKKFGREVRAKTKSYVALDQKKAVVMTSWKSDTQIKPTDVKKVQDLISNLFGGPPTSDSSASFSSIIQL
uniref:Uncharacterized protein n=1 Tax=Caenorhabditis japonica TaxID=281687 RepID=A0A8R1DYB9_CAEJA